MTNRIVNIGWVCHGNRQNNAILEGQLEFLEVSAAARFGVVSPQFDGANDTNVI
jgi:hypothetical protein